MCGRSPSFFSTEAPFPHGALFFVRLLREPHCQLTLRDSNEGRLLQRLAAVLKQYPAPQPAPQASSQGQGQDWCAVHNVAMRWNEGKEGRKGWYSHRVGDMWCKGKGR
jgi:hypothetical protein